MIKSQRIQYESGYGAVVDQGFVHNDRGITLVCREEGTEALTILVNFSSTNGHVISMMTKNNLSLS